MNDLMLNASRWLWDYFLLASVLLLIVTIVAKLVGQPARRMAIHWSTAASLVLLALLCCVPGWSVVHMLSAPPESPIPLPEFEPALGPAIQLAPIPTQLPSTNLPPGLDIPLVDIDNAPTPKSAPAVVTAIDYGVLSCYVLISGSLLCLLWLFVGYWQLRRIRQQATPAPAELVALLNQLAVGQQTPQLGIATKLPVAAAVGLRRPMILLPQILLPRNSADQTSPPELRSVLAHELAHIRHRDLWLLAIMRGLQLLLWPHPLYWLWRRNVRLDQETLADAAAADVTDRTDYAERLVAWARVAAEMRPPRLASSVGLWESPSQLKRRIAILLDEKLNVLRSCSLRWKFSSAILLVVLAGGLSLVTLQPKSSIAAKPSETTLSEAKHQGRVKKIADGATVELLAIGTNARDEDTKWWDADGKPIDELPFEVLTSTNIRPLPNRQLVFRVHDLPGDADVRWRTDPASNSSSGTIVLDGMKRPYSYYSHEFERPRQSDTFSLRVGVAVGDWATIASGISGAQSMFRKGVVFSDALSDRDGNAVVIVSHSYSDVDTRGLAIDDKGNEWISTSRRGSSAGKQNQSQWTFVGLKPDQVKSFGLQIRQYQWVEFEDLPTDSGNTDRNVGVDTQTQRKIDSAIAVLTTPNLIDPVEKWGWSVKELVDLGPVAVPPLIETLDSEIRDHPIRKLVFTLRAIDDPRALPALIRTIPKTHLPPSSDYGLSVKDEELKKFLTMHDTHTDGDHLTYGRALSETFRTLQKMSGGQSFGEMELIFAHKQGTPKQQKIQRKLFQKVALGWAKWWEENWKNYVEDERYSNVNLPPELPERAAIVDSEARFPFGEGVRLSQGSQSVIITPNQVRQREDLLDIDSIRHATWPGNFQALGKNDQPTPEMTEWWRSEGFDLLGFVEMVDEESTRYGVRMLDLRAWKLGKKQLADLPKMMSGEIPYPLGNEAKELIPLHSNSGPFSEPDGTPYLFRTREGTYGLIKLHEPGGFPYPSVKASIQYFVNKANKVSNSKLTSQNLPLSPQPSERATLSLQYDPAEDGGLSGSLTEMSEDNSAWELVVASPPSDSDAAAESQDTLTIATTPAESDSDEIQSLDLRAGPVVPADREESSSTVAAAQQPKQPDTQNLAKVMRPLHQQLEAKRRPNTILGICVNEQGQPLAEVDVQVYSQRAGFLSSQPPTSVAKTKSNRQGIFRFDQVIDIEKVYPDGIPSIHTPARNQRFYTCVGRVNGRVPGRSSELAATLAMRGQVVVWVMQEAKTLRGRITDAAGKPIANATVKAGVGALLRGQNDLQLGSATTNNNGEYAIDHLPDYNAASAARQRAEMIKKNPMLAQTMSSEPSQQLLVTHPDFAAKRVTIRSIPGETNAQLRPGSTIEGRITFPTDDEPDPPVSGVAYLQRDMPEQKPGELTVPFSLQVQSVAIRPDGRYRFESLPGGTYHLSAKVADYVTNGIENVVAPAGKTTTAADIKFTRGGLVRLQLLDDSTGEPLQLDEATRGWVNPQRVPREQVFPGTNNVVMFSPQATGETRLAPGEYRLHVNIPNDDGSGALIASEYLDIKSPEDLENLPTIKIQDGETIDVRVKMSRWEPTDRATTGTFQAAATPSDLNGKDNDESEESTVDEDVIFFKVQQTVPSDADSSTAIERDDQPNPLVNELEKMLEPSSADDDDTIDNETRSNRVTVTLADPETIRQVEFPWTVRGRVTDAEGKGLADVEVRAATGVGTLLGGGRTKTDDEGRYLLRFGPGMHMKVSKHAPLGVGVQAASIYASKPGWSEENLCRHGDLLMTDRTPETLGEGAKNWGNKSADDVVFADQPKTVNFVMQPAVTLEGEFVESSRNWEVEDQSISITGPELPPSSSVLKSLKTDRKGKFSYEHLPTDHEWRFTMRIPKTAVDLESKPFRFDKPGHYRCRLVLETSPAGDSTALALLVEDLQRIDP